MPQPLPRLRLDLDFMPSPIEDRPGLLIRDTYRYSDATLIIPPVLIPCLECFDGQQTENDLRQELVRITGDLEVGSLVDHLAGTLENAGFLHGEVFEKLREERIREFAAAPVRLPIHAGAAYPEDKADTRAVLAEYLDGSVPNSALEPLIGIAAPHVSPFGGVEAYRAAFGALGPEYKDRVFVILGTSHYGEPDRFGLTRKNFVTPYGETRTQSRLVDELAAQPAALLEDYCHSIEHSIEFQVLFLQHIYGADVRILPILCGSFARSIHAGNAPDQNDAVKSFLENLGDIAAREGDNLFWVLGIDMAHIGARYGDQFEARAGDGRMLEVAERDHARIGAISAGDAAGFWDLVREGGRERGEDELRWCGSSPVYSFMRAMPQARGRLRRYQQWNIDEQSVVSFAGMSFTA